MHPLREIINDYQLSAKKSLGQNFLLDLNLTNKIARMAGDLSNHTILEIGPGNGKLTDHIIFKKPKRLTLVEIDTRLAEDLLIKYSKFNYSPSHFTSFLEIL